MAESGPERNWFDGSRSCGNAEPDIEVLALLTPDGSVPATSPTGGAPETLCARSAGDGPPVLLLHGLVGSSRYWNSSYDDLARRHRLIIPDLLGFGRSPKPASDYSPDRHVEAVIALLDELGVDAPAVVGAHSAGSILALRLAWRHPDRVAAVVAFGPPLYPDERAAREHLAHMGPMARLFALPGPLAARACGWVCAHRELAARLAVRTHPHLPPAVAADSVQHTWASYTGTVTEVVLAAEAGSWLGNIDAPVTLVAGDRDRVVDAAYLRLLAGSPTVRFEMWAGDHHLPLRRSARCVEVLLSARDSHR